MIQNTTRGLGTMKQQKMYTQGELDTARQDGYTVEEVNTLLCVIRTPEDDGVIDHIAISDDDDTIIIGRYEIAELIEYLQRMYDIGA